MAEMRAAVLTALACLIALLWHTVVRPIAIVPVSLALLAILAVNLLLAFRRRNATQVYKSAASMQPISRLHYTRNAAQLDNTQPLSSTMAVQSRYDARNDTTWLQSSLRGPRLDFGTSAFLNWAGSRADRHRQPLLRFTKVRSLCSSSSLIL